MIIRTSKNIVIARKIISVRSMIFEDKTNTRILLNAVGLILNFNVV